MKHLPVTPIIINTVKKKMVKVESNIFSKNEASKEEIRQYSLSQTKYLYTTRFSDSTYMSNRMFCDRYNLEGIYCTVSPIPSNRVPLKSIVYVLEMNNTTQTIMAIGKILNNFRDDIYRIYDKEIYNQRHYRVKKRITVEQMTEEEQVCIRALEYHCFKTKGHLKRGQGLTSFPIVKMTTGKRNGYDVLQAIDQMFISRKKPETKATIKAT